MLRLRVIYDVTFVCVRVCVVCSVIISLYYDIHNVMCALYKVFVTLSILCYNYHYIHYGSWVRVIR